MSKILAIPSLAELENNIRESRREFKRSNPLENEQAQKEFEQWLDEQKTK